jgi:hypothetical protein
MLDREREREALLALRTILLSGEDVSCGASAIKHAIS